MEMTLKKRVMNSGAWILFGHFFSQALRLGSNLIMTRLLVPEMFGIMAIANVIMVGLAMMSDMGIRQNIIQSKSSDKANFLNTAWVVQIIRGIILWIMALIICYIIVVLTGYQLWPEDSVYAEPILPYIIAVISFTAVITGFESTKLAIAHRKLAMKQVIKIELLSQCAGLTVMISWAYLDRTIWALVAGTYVSTISKVVLSHIFLPGPGNKLNFDKASFYELFHFGKWMFLTSILGFLAMNGDKLILGGLIDAKLLGLYTIAVFIVGAVQQVLGKIIGSVALPALSEVIRSRPGELKSAYYKFRFPIDSVSLFLAGLLFMMGSSVIDILYDERYSAAGHFLEILSLLLLTERYSIAGQCFVALGKPNYMVPIIAVRVVILYSLLPVFYNYYGFVGAIWFIGLHRLFTIPILFYIKIKNSLFDVVKEVYVLPFFILGLFIGWFINILLIKLLA